jgi:hypothetical protein
MNKEVIAGIILFALVFIVPFLLDKNDRPTVKGLENIEIDSASGGPCYTNGHPLWNDC